MKKRILSLILALSMVLSVLPLGAFAADPLPELVMGADGLPDTTNVQKTSIMDHGKRKDKYVGYGWEYTKDSSDSTDTGILTLRDGRYDFGSTHPQGGGNLTTEPVLCAIEIQGAEIIGGSFKSDVTNRGDINGGEFQSTGIVTNEGTISGGKFEGTVTNSGTITGYGTFAGKVTNCGNIEGNGIFHGPVTNTGNGKIVGGTFKNSVTSTGNGVSINGGKFEGAVTNNDGATIFGGTFQSTGSVTNGNGAAIGGGTFNGKVGNIGTISGGTFNETVTNASTGTISDGTFNGDVTNYGTIKDNGTFEGTVTNKINGLIYGGTFQSTGSVTNYGNITGNGTFAGIVTNNRFISGGTFQNTCSVTNANDGTISDGTFAGRVTNNKTISGGTFQNGCSVTNWSTISGGTFQNTCSVTNNGTIKDNGIFEGEVKNYTSGTILDGTFRGEVDNSGAIEKGTFEGSVQNNNRISGGTFQNGCSVTNLSTISGGTFQNTCSVTNHGYIKNGTFAGKVTNDDGTIYGGTFAGSVENKWKIYGGVFNGKTGLDGVTNLHSITVASGAKIEKVNGVFATWDPYVVVTENATTKEVTITANTEIYSLNGQPIGPNNCKSSYGNDKTTVTFTMPNENVVLSGAITCTNLVMKGGYPEASNGGTTPCKGNGWTYSKKDTSNPKGKLTLTDGTYDFGYTYPQNSNGAGAEPVACAVETQLRVEITGGTFEEEVINNDLGVISGGTFHEKVSNYNGMITGGTFKSSVTSKGHGRIFGGVFNGNATLTNVTGLHSITVASGAKIKEVNGMSADWDPYVVVTENATTNEVIITADTEIFSLNGKSIGDGNCKSSYDGSDYKTVKFTMPDDKDVVLNGAITCTDLVMEKGYPKDSDGGKNPCKGDGWEYIKNDPTNGDMLLLTGNSQTGGLYDFSAIGDGSAVECNVFVGKPTAITGGEFNGKVFNNSGILGGTFNGEVENMGPGTIKDGTFKNSVENNGMIENGAFHDAVENNGTINDGTFHDKVENNNAIKDGTFNGEVDNTASGTIEKGTFHDAVENKGTINGGVFNGAVTSSGTVSESITGSGTLNGEPITKTPEPEPEPKPEPEPEPEPTTYTVTVIGGTIDGKTSVSAKENDTLTVVLDQNDIPDGMTFDMWSISSSKLSGDINVDYRAEAMTFPMPPEDVTIRAQYRSAEIIEDAAPSPLATAATIAVGGAAAGIVVWQGVSLGVDLYLANALPQGVPVPTDRRALALLLWETAGKPEVALPTLYGDIPAEEIELQKATRWAVQNGLMDAADKKDASFFDPDHYVTKMDVFGAWLRLKKLLGTT